MRLCCRPLSTKLIHALWQDKSSKSQLSHVHRCRSSIVHIVQLLSFPELPVRYKAMAAQQNAAPFAVADELNGSLSNWNPADPQQALSLPGQPRLSLADNVSILEFLAKDLVASDLDALESKLWWITTPSATNITALHAQHLRGRQIVVTEDPDLHLVWRRHDIFIKPIPDYLLCHAFWAQLLPRLSPTQAVQRQTITQAALGYLRSYAYLIRYPSDFRIAQREDNRLIPKHVTWETWSKFIAAFEHSGPSDVSPRYRRYGELRYSRLSILGKLLFIRWTYRYTAGESGDYFEPFFAPLLFLFAALAIMLNAMQVTLAAESLQNYDWEWFWKISRWFSVSTLLLSVSLGVLMLLLLVRKICCEIFYAVRHRLKMLFR